MDRAFLEFWGNAFLNMAKGQKQMEDLAQWMNKGLQGTEEFATLFKKFYGLDKPAKAEPEEKQQTWQTATDQFMQSFEQYLALMGVVSRERYNALEAELKALRAKVSDQAKTIEELEQILHQKPGMQDKALQGFERLVRQQSDQFQRLMTQTRDFLQQSATDTQSEKKK